MATQEVLKNPFRNSMGKRYLRGLFFEESPEDKSACLYTLKREDHLGYISLYRLFMNEGDLTEYRFATKYLDGWSHWQELSQSSWFKPYIEDWRHELEVKVRSLALVSIQAVAADPSHSASFQANRYLLEGVWKPAGASKRGRPTKDEVKAEIIAQATSNGKINDDAKRIGLNIN